jgi:hypothetical protein
MYIDYMRPLEYSWTSCISFEVLLPCMHSCSYGLMNMTPEREPQLT